MNFVNQNQYQTIKWNVGFNEYILIYRSIHIKGENPNIIYNLERY